MDKKQEEQVEETKKSQDEKESEDINSIAKQSDIINTSNLLTDSSSVRTEQIDAAENFEDDNNQPTVPIKQMVLDESLNEQILHYEPDEQKYKASNSEEVEEIVDISEELQKSGLSRKQTVNNMLDSPYSVEAISAGNISNNESFKSLDQEEEFAATASMTPDINTSDHGQNTEEDKKEEHKEKEKTYPQKCELSMPLIDDFIEVNQDSPILNVTECKANDNYNESCLVGKLETDELSQEPIADIPATSSNAELIPETSNIQEPLAPLSQVEATYSTSESSTTSDVDNNDHLNEEPASNNPLESVQAEPNIAMWNAPYQGYYNPAPIMQLYMPGHFYYCPLPNSPEYFGIDQAGRMSHLQSFYQPHWVQQQFLHGVQISVEPPSFRVQVPMADYAQQVFTQQSTPVPYNIGNHQRLNVPHNSLPLQDGNQNVPHRSSYVQRAPQQQIPFDFEVNQRLAVPQHSPPIQNGNRMRPPRQNYAHYPQPAPERHNFVADQGIPFPCPTPPQPQNENPIIPPQATPEPPNRYDQQM